MFGYFESNGGITRSEARPQPRYKELLSIVAVRVHQRQEQRGDQAILEARKLLSFLALDRNLVSVLSMRMTVRFISATGIERVVPNNNDNDN